MILKPYKIKKTTIAVIFFIDVLFDTFKSLRPVRRRRRTPVFALSGGYISQPADHPMPRLRRHRHRKRFMRHIALKNRPFFDRTVTAQIYKPPLSFLIRRYKYGDGWQLSSLLAKFLPPPPPTDSVLAVPLHPARERWRGFNQSRELAREIFGPSPATTNEFCVSPTPHRRQINLTPPPEKRMFAALFRRQTN